MFKREDECKGCVFTGTGRTTACVARLSCIGNRTPIHFSVELSKIKFSLIAGKENVVDEAVIILFRVYSALQKTSVKRSTLPQGNSFLTLKLYKNNVYEYSPSDF